MQDRSHDLDHMECVFHGVHRASFGLEGKISTLIACNFSSEAVLMYGFHVLFLSLQREKAVCILSSMSSEERLEDIFIYIIYLLAFPLWVTVLILVM